MSRGAEKTAKTAADQSKQTFAATQALTGASEGKTNDLYSQLTPIYKGEATNPQGFSPEDLGAINTASQQSLGGSEAGAVGAGNLTAARTRNAGGFQPASDESARSSMRIGSENAMGVQEKNAALREANRQAGISGLSGLYSTNNQDVLSSLGLQTGATHSTIEAANAQSEAARSGWFQNMVSLINAGAGAAKAASGFGSGGGGGE